MAIWRKGCQVHILLRSDDANYNTFYCALELSLHDFQFGFSAGSGCSEASFVIMEAINHIKEREGKFLPVSWMYAKHLTVWIDGLLYKLFSKLGVEENMFAVIKALYTDVASFVYFNGVSTQAFSLYQGAGQGRILALFMYEVYIYRLIETVCNSKYS